MILIIDGYNLIKQVETATFISTELRAQFMTRLERYAQAKVLNILLVFDGGERGRTAQTVLQVIYAGQRETADDVIRKLLRSFSRRSLQDQVLLITNDRELLQQANLCQITSLGAVLFYDFLLKFERQPAAVATALSAVSDWVVYSSNTPELDTLMVAGSQQLPASKLAGAPVAAGARVVQPQTSKLARKLKKKLARL